jgi:hypothetical protein
VRKLFRILCQLREAYQVARFRIAYDSRLLTSGVTRILLGIRIQPRPGDGFMRPCRSAFGNKPPAIAYPFFFSEFSE